MSWVETTIGPDAQSDGDQNGRCTRHFIFANAVSPASIQADPTNFLGGVTGSQPLPDYGSQHPEDNSLQLVDWHASQDGVHVRAIATYAKSTLDARLTEDFLSRSGSFQTEIYNLPFAFKKVQRPVRLDGDGQPVFVPGTVEPYDIREMPILTTQRRRTVIVRVKETSGNFNPGFGGVRPSLRLRDVIRIMDRQHNKLHQINGIWERFEAGDYREVRYGIWEVRYSWVIESGIPFYNPFRTQDRPDVSIGPPPGNTRPLLVFPGPVRNVEFDSTVIGIPDEDYFIPPFCKLEPLPSETRLATDPPRFRVILRYKIDRLGWRELPQYAEP